MRIRINHTTRYAYTEPQRMIVQSHRLNPALCHSQTIGDWQIDCSEPAEFGSLITEANGDQIRSLCVENVAEFIEITIQGFVDAHDTNGVIKLDSETVSPQVYLRETNLTKADTKLLEAAKETNGADSREPLELAHALMSQVSANLTYTKGVTSSSVSAAQAFAQGQGVCQDYAHCLISMARANAIPARYVTGYLFTEVDQMQHDASHAWAELHVQGLGWVGFDATNDCCPDARYLRLGSGLDAEQAALIRGISRGAGEEHMHTQVTVSAAQQ